MITWFKNRLRAWLAEPTAAPQPVIRGRTIDGAVPLPTMTEKQRAFRESLADALDAPTPYTTNTNAAQANETLRMSLMGLSAGWWASDHAEEAQHFTGWNYCAVHSKAKQSALASIRVFRRVPAKTKKPLDTVSKIEKSSTNPDQPEYDLEPLPPDHPACRLLTKPNPRWSHGLWRYQISQQLNLTGSALLWTVKDRLGRPAEIWVIPTALARPQMPTVQMPMGAYWVTATGLFTMSGGFPTSYGIGALAGITIDARDVRPVRWPHPTLLADGQSPLAAGAVQIDLADEIDKAAWAALHNEVDPSMVISLDSSMQVDSQEIERVEHEINAKRAGVTNKGKIFIMQGATPQQMHRSPSELDYSASRPQTRDAVLAIQGVPPIFCGIAEAGSHAAYFTSLKQAIELSVQPELDLVAGELTLLFRELYQDQTLEVVITAKSFDDPDVLERKRQTNIAAKSVTINEDRVAMGMAPVWWGDVQIGTAIPPDQLDDDFDHVATYGEAIALRRQEQIDEQAMDGQDEIDDAAESGQPDEATSITTGIKQPDRRKPQLTGLKKSAATMRTRLKDHMLNGWHRGESDDGASTD